MSKDDFNILQAFQIVNKYNSYLVNEINAVSLQIIEILYRNSLTACQLVNTPHNIKFGVNSIEFNGGIAIKTNNGIPSVFLTPFGELIFIDVDSSINCYNYDSKKRNAISYDFTVKFNALVFELSNGELIYVFEKNAKGEQVPKAKIDYIITNHDNIEPNKTIESEKIWEQLYHQPCNNTIYANQTNQPTTLINFSKSLLHIGIAGLVASIAGVNGIVTIALGYGIYTLGHSAYNNLYQIDTISKNNPIDEDLVDLAIATISGAICVKNPVLWVGIVMPYIATELEMPHSPTQQFNITLTEVANYFYID